MSTMNAGITYYQSLLNLGVSEETAAKVVTSLDLNIDTRINQGLERLETKFDTKFNAIETKFDSKLNAIETKFDSKIDSIKWLLGILITVMIATLATNGAILSKMFLS